MWEKEDKKNLDEMLEKLNTLDDEAEREHYKRLLTDWHKRDMNKERSHSRKRDLRSFDSLENLMEKGKHRKPLNSKLCRYEDFENVIFSENPEDLQELVTDGFSGTH